MQVPTMFHFEMLFFKSGFDIPSFEGGEVRLTSLGAPKLRYGAHLFHRRAGPSSKEGQEKNAYYGSTAVPASVGLFLGLFPDSSASKEGPKRTDGLYRHLAALLLIGTRLRLSLA